MVYACTATFLAVYIGVGIVNGLPTGLSGLFQSRLEIPLQSDDDVAILAQEFKDISPIDATVLIPPLDHEFRFYSQRSVPFTFKSFPFTDAGIGMWQQRLESFSGQSLFDRELDLNSQPSNADILHTLINTYEQLGDEAIVDLAKQYDANYILTRLAWHPSVEGSVVAQQGDWVVYQIQPPQSQ